MDVFLRDHDMAQVLSGVGGLHYIIIFHYVTVYCGFCLEMTQTDSTSIVYICIEYLESMSCMQGGALDARILVCI